MRIVKRLPRDAYWACLNNDNLRPLMSVAANSQCSISLSAVCVHGNCQMTVLPSVFFFFLSQVILYSVICPSRQVETGTLNDNLAWPQNTPPVGSTTNITTLAAALEIQNAASIEFPNISNLSSIEHLFLVSISILVFIYSSTLNTIL
jgi:hypothetical protein